MSRQDSTKPATRSRYAVLQRRGSFGSGWLLPSAGVVLPLIALTAIGGCKKSTQSAGPQAPAQVEAPPPNPANNLLRNADFADGTLPWTTALTAPARGSAEVKDGALCINLEDKGKDNWDALVAHRNLVIQEGHSYTLDFRAWSSASTLIRPKVGMAGPPYGEYWVAPLPVGPEPQRYQSDFVMTSPTDKAAEFTFHLGGSLAKTVPLTICIDDIYLTDTQFQAAPREQDQPPPKVAVNQLGYLPKLSKIAVLESSAAEPQKWELVDASGAVVADGETKPFGADPNSGNSVHRIDFSSFKKEGAAYVLRVGDEKSYPFDVGKSVYKKLKYDALAFFYHDRSGIEIKMPYAGEERWARPAGHLPDKAPCGKDLGCKYTLDVTGGWYDAGDHGKYVVNGGFSAWVLLNQWERTEYLGKSIKDFADGKLNIPEHGNGVDDLLDEARWEVQFMMAMQAPDGTEFAGMVHHKMHDEGWTAIPT
ncbi:MAG: Cellulase, partial [Pseudomonadota bacterium]